MQAVVNRRHDEARTLLAQGANPDIEVLVPLCNNHYGVAPLHVACRMGDAEMVSLLLEHGADKDSFSTVTCTPLHEAVAGGSATVVDLLLSRGAKPNQGTANREDGCSIPLQIAVKSGSTEITTMLLAHGANVNYDTGGGCTILWHIINLIDWRVTPEMLKVLVEHGAHIPHKHTITVKNPEAEFLVYSLCMQFPRMEPVFMVGDAKIPAVERLVELGDSAVDACKLGFCETRLVYDILARIWSKPSVDALLTQLALTHDMLGREMLAVPWQSTELSCQSLSRLQHPSVRNAIPLLKKLEYSKVGEVVVASRHALTSIEKSFPTPNQ